MLVYRIASARYPAANSEGAKRTGGRWNLAGFPVIYAASTKSLATLEVLVHHGAIPADYRIIAIEIPEDIAIHSIERSDLPEDWSASSSHELTAAMGTTWVRTLRSAVLKVPSTIYPDEFNYVINPDHPDFHRLTFLYLADSIDSRLQPKQIGAL